MSRFYYRHFGLTLAADVELPGLRSAAAGAVDLAVEVERPSACPTVEPPWVMIDPPYASWRAPGGAGSRLRLRFHGTGGRWAEFEIADGGGHVRMSLGEEAELAEAIQLLIGTVFSCVLAQRGATCLHASVVAYGGRVIALVGPKRAGKSTLALACIRQGAELISDDVAAVSLRGPDVMTAVGSPQLKICADAAGALAGSFEALRPIWIDEPQRPRKRYYDLVAQPEREVSVRLTGICLLAPRGDSLPSARALTPGELLPRLVAARHVSSVLDRDGHRRDFACLAALVARVPGRELQRPDDLSRVDSSVDIVFDAVG